ncbi:MAG: VOC family protein [Variovorax sp.]
MSPSLSLAYLVFEASGLADWRRFCDRVLGLPQPSVNTDGSLGFQVDARCQRLVVQAGPRDDVVALGFDCGDDAALDALLARLAGLGHTATAAGEALRAARRVRRLHVLLDPDGNRVELCTGLAAAAQPFASDAFPDGFVTGDLGLGHAVLVSRQVPRMEAFYVDALGFGVTERLDTRVGPIRLSGVFMHCNRRHHTLALFDLPMAKRMHHFMLQAPAVRDIGLAYERAQQCKVPMSLDLGQHPAPDSTLSFYGATPSGFDFEIGAGTQEIEPQQWQSRQMSQTSSWGHKPRLRLQLKMAAGLVRQKMGRGHRAAPNETEAA